MTKDELIREAEHLFAHAPSNNDLWSSQTLKVRYLLESALEMLSRSIVWQDGEPPRDFVLPDGAYMLLDDGVSIYLVDSWGDNDWKYAFIAHHAIFTPPQAIDWPGESPLELTPEQEKSCEQALKQSDKYLKPQEPNDDND